MEKEGIDVALSPGIEIISEQRQLAAALSAHVARLAAASFRARKRFCVALSGGSLMDIIAPVLSTAPLRERINWPAWQVFWVDERWVPPSSPESNSGAAQRRLFSRVTVPGEQLYAANTSLSPDEGAQAYESLMRKVFQTRSSEFLQFDLILLGLGADGHTASLFPGHSALKESRRWVVPVLNAPKPPPVRITMTLPVINHARHVVFVASGPGKSKIISKVFHPKNELPDFPAQMVKPLDGEVRWFIDRAAAGDA